MTGFKDFPPGMGYLAPVSTGFKETQLKRWVLRLKQRKLSETQLKRWVVQEVWRLPLPERFWGL
jgi:hypothetical protein